MIKISNSIQTQFPNLKLGLIIARGVSNSNDCSQILKHAQQHMADLKRRFPTIESLSESQSIVDWREIYSKLGSKPSKYRPTVEALIRRIIKGEELPSINRVVTSYLLAEIQTLMPIGGYDLDRIQGDILLRHSKGDEEFSDFSGKMGRTFENEVVYSDDKRVLTRRWNHRDCLETQITAESKNIMLCCEIPNGNVASKDVKQTLELIAIYLQRYCQAENIQTEII